MPLRIAFGYKARSGKDTAVDYLIQKLGGVRLRNAESLYEVCSDIQIKIGVEVKKDPLLLQEVGMMVRGIYGVDVWVNTQIAKLNSTENFFVKIDRDASLRANDRDSKHISEVDLDDAEFDIIIKNNGMLEEFYKKIDEIIEVILRREQYPLTK
jgi:hypothetical protein